LTTCTEFIGQLLTSNRLVVLGYLLPFFRVLAYGHYLDGLTGKLLV
jgi:hypothetical protein